MKSIILVCRSWYNVGTGFLYQHICIRRFPQLECLHEPLYASSARNLGALVKSLDIRCYIPEKLAPEFAKNLCAIMKLCPFLVTHLHLHHSVQYIDLVSILRDLQDQLLGLHFEISPTLHDGGLFFFVPPFQVVPDLKLIFPSLLRLSFADWGSSAPRALNVLMAYWSMPSLQRLTKSDHSTLDKRYQEAIIDFLSTHGRRLRHLHMGIWSPFGHPFSKALEQCPLLEHLVMHPATFERAYWTPENEVLHSKLRFLDLTYSFSERPTYPDSELWISKEVLPSLELVRHLCNIPSYLNAWVDSFEPSSEIGSTDFAICLFEHQVTYKNGDLLYRFKRKKKPLAIESSQKPIMSWTFTVWEDMADADDEHSGSEDESSSNPGVSSDEPSSGDDEWMFDSGDDASTLSR